MVELAVSVLLCLAISQHAEELATFDYDPDQ